MNEKRAKFGKTFYSVVIILSAIILLLSLILIKAKDETDEARELMFIYRYMVTFYILAGVIPISLLVRELCIGEYNKKRIIIKFLTTTILVIGGSLLIFLIWKLQVCQYLVLVTMLNLVLVITPSEKSDKNNEKKV